MSEWQFAGDTVRENKLGQKFPRCNMLLHAVRDPVPAGSGLIQVDAEPVPDTCGVVEKDGPHQNLQNLL